MPQGRIILKSICQSKKLANLKTDGARLLYTWLLPNLDINGCYSGDPDVIKGQILTRLKKSIKTVESYLNDLEDKLLIIRYELNGDMFLNVPDFKDKQPQLNADREGKPSIPLPPPNLLQTYSRVNQDQIKTNSPLSKVKESKTKVKESKEMPHHKYGEYKHVLLTDKQYDKLIKDFDEETILKAIKILDEGIQMKGYKYKDYNLAIRNWPIDEAKKKSKQKSTDEQMHDDLQRRRERDDRERVQ